MFYLSLFHGRTDPNESLDDWGSDGPIIGPFEFVQWTYGTLRLITPAGDDVELSQFHTQDERGELREDLVHVMGVWYGDFSVMTRKEVGEFTAPNLKRLITWPELSSRIADWTAREHHQPDFQI